MTEGIILCSDELDGPIIVISTCFNTVVNLYSPYTNDFYLNELYIPT